MQEYKYTYQKWKIGNPIPTNLGRMLYNNEISREDYEKINTERETALKYIVERELKRYINWFLYRYNKCILKHSMLEEEIESRKEQIEEYKTNYPNVYEQVMYDDIILSKELSYQDIQQIYSKDYHQNKLVKTVYSNKTPLVMIVAMEFLQWLLWFKKKEIQRADELFEQHYQNFIKHPNKEKFAHPALTYIWQGDIKEVDILYNRLLKAKLIANDTDKDNFTSLFSEVPVDSIVTIKWEGNQNLLAYLIDQLYDNNKLPDNTEIWRIATHCFTKGKNLKQSKNNYYKINKNNKPKGFSVIDKILAELT